MIKELKITTNKQNELIDITDEIELLIKDIKEGICYVYTPHTTAAITINENADPDVKHDIIKALTIFNRDDYHHSEGNSQAHVKASLIGSSETLIIENNKLLLGTWQGITFCEFDGPRQRKVFVKVIKYEL